MGAGRSVAKQSKLTEAKAEAVIVFDEGGVCHIVEIGADRGGACAYRRLVLLPYGGEVAGKQVIVLGLGRAVAGGPHAVP